MASSPILLLSTLVFSVIFFLSAQPTYSSSQLIFTIVNNCPFTIWPAILANTGQPTLQKGGFALETLQHRSFFAPTTSWSGRIWARTHCTYNTNSHTFSCLTGDCANRLECDGHGGQVPATLAEFSLHHGGQNDFSSYGVSLVDGFNLPMTVTPHEGKGHCPVVGCKANLLGTCPKALQVISGGAGVVACKSGCEAFKNDEMCCRGKFNDPKICKGNQYTEFFKHQCPSTMTYAHDAPQHIHQCASPKELKVIFCH